MCPKQAVFTVYSGQDCQGTATGGGPVSLSYMNRPCQEVLLGAQSAILKCYQRGRGEARGGLIELSGFGGEEGGRVRCGRCRPRAV